VIAFSLTSIVVDYRNNDHSCCAVYHGAGATWSRFGDDVWLRERSSDGDALKFGGTAASRQSGLSSISNVNLYWSGLGDVRASLARTCDPCEGQDRRHEDCSAQSQSARQGLKPHLGEDELCGAALTSLAPGEWSVPTLSAELGMPTASIYNWIYRGWITARHAPGTRNWIITADQEQMRQLRERRARPPGFYTRARWAQPQHEPDQQQGTQP